MLFREISGLGKKIDFFGVGPYFAESGGVREGRLTGVGLPPPTLRVRTIRDFHHVRFKISPGVFEIGEEIEFPFNFPFVDGKVPDVGPLDCRIDLGPGIGMEVSVMISFFRFEAGDPGETLNRFRRW